MHNLLRCLNAENRLSRGNKGLPLNSLEQGFIKRGDRNRNFSILIMLNILLLIVGMFMEPTVSIIILVPILFPLIESLGIHPIHFGIVMLMNLTIGVATPPLGLVLFTACSISGLSLERLVKAIIPFLCLELLVLLAVTYWPAMSLTVPRIFGLLP